MRYSYSDPTANTAIANVDRERRREEKRRKLLEQKAYERYIKEVERKEGGSIQSFPRESKKSSS